MNKTNPEPTQPDTSTLLLPRQTVDPALLAVCALLRNRDACSGKGAIRNLEETLAFTCLAKEIANSFNALGERAQFDRLTDNLGSEALDYLMRKEKMLRHTQGDCESEAMAYFLKEARGYCRQFKGDRTLFAHIRRWFESEGTQADYERYRSAWKIPNTDGEYYIPACVIDNVITWMKNRKNWRQSRAKRSL
jgi:hypothetical protein